MTSPILHVIFAVCPNVAYDHEVKQEKVVVCVADYSLISFEGNH